MEFRDEDLSGNTRRPERWSGRVHEAGVWDNPLPVKRPIADAYGRGESAGLVRKGTRELVCVDSRQRALDLVQFRVPSLLEECGFGFMHQL